jgi:hypothetical protein
MVASGFFNEVLARDAVASLSHRRAANKCGAAILPFDSGTALGRKDAMAGHRLVIEARDDMQVGDAAARYPACHAPDAGSRTRPGLDSPA